MSVSTVFAGAMLTQDGILVGAGNTQETRMDARECGFGMVYTDKAAKGIVAQIADHVRAACPSREKAK